MSHRSIPLVLLLLSLLLPAVASCGPWGVKVRRVSTPRRERLVPEGGALAEGTYVHPGSGLRFAQGAKDAARLDVKPYDKEGMDVGIGYLVPGLPLVFTVYVYPHPQEESGALRAFDAHFESELAEVRRGRPDIAQKASGTLRGRLAGREVKGRSVEFEFSGGDEFGGARVGSVISVFPVGGWLIKYRLTWAVALRERALAASEDVLAALGLPATGIPKH